MEELKPYIFEFDENGTIKNNIYPSKDALYNVDC